MISKNKLIVVSIVSFIFLMLFANYAYAECPMSEYSPYQLRAHLRTIITGFLSDPSSPTSTYTKDEILDLLEFYRKNKDKQLIPDADCSTRGSITATEIYKILKKTIIFTHDLTPPELSDLKPEGIISARWIALSLTTDERAICKYSTTQGIPYSSMANTFSTTGSTLHSQPLSILTEGEHNYSVRCMDNKQNANINDTIISFTADRPKFVFITSTTYNGNLGGLSGADAKCQARADTAGLGGAWKAWLSDSLESPSSRFDTAHNYSYRLFDGTLVANGWGDLTDNSIASRINLDENGTLQANKYVWTNTYPNGSVLLSTAYTCMDWTNASSSITYVGYNLYTTWRWTQYDRPVFCYDSYPLYCFEQCLRGYEDKDVDGYTIGTQQTLCDVSSLPQGYSSTSLGIDCDDSNINKFQNLQGYVDNDNDGYTVGNQLTVCSGSSLPTGYSSTSSSTPDCDDTRNARWRLRYRDLDFDGYGAGTAECVGNEAGYSDIGTDCDNTNGNIWQYKYKDNDGDGYTDGQVCVGNQKGYFYTSAGTDCNDNNPTLRQYCDKRVFVTSIAYTGNLGGLSGADAKCVEKANAAKLCGGSCTVGSWKAWLSDGITSASSRLTHSPGPYRLVDPDSRKIADSWADLTANGLQTPLVRDENNNLQGGKRVWTNTAPNGYISYYYFHCNSWAIASTNPGYFGDNSYYKYPSSSSYLWTQASVSQCLSSYHLYCFEQ